ncbi:ankyrin repeat-containing domain protein [Xylariomycetidae sp. FL2044]|nr:ankyrin repeat-containing domain protein [Xylariomycetidae sp. FL2044]
MDPLSFSASLIAVIQLSAKVVQLIATASGAAKDRSRLRTALQGCDDFLQQLRDNSDGSEESRAWEATIAALEAPGSPLWRLGSALDTLRTKLESQGKQSGIVTSLKWPFDEKELKAIIETVECEKSLLSLALSNESRKLLQAIQKSAKQNADQLARLIATINQSSDEQDEQLSKLADSLRQVQISQANVQNDVERLHAREDVRDAGEERRRILDWISPTDYTSEQNDFLSRRQPGTGQWLLDSTEYQTWLQTNGSTLYCHGMPGAGKTMLSSIVIDDLSTRFHSNISVGIAYIFFNFRRQEEQRAESLMAPLLKQLAQRLFPLPKPLYDLYNDHVPKGTRPQDYKIDDCLSAVAAQCSCAFLILDALDECRTSDDSLIRFLGQVFRLQKNCHINILATSRPIPNIMNKFQGNPSLEIRATDEDVKKYLKGRISQSESRVLQEHEGEIVRRITETVDGMFLLAQLYFDQVKSKKTLKRVKDALNNLVSGPAAYDSAYEDAMKRIMDQDEDSRDMAESMLALIVCGCEPPSLKELRYALAVEPDTSDLDEENIPDIDDMISVCAGLVTVDTDKRNIGLIHYTTQEYFQNTHQRWFPDVHPKSLKIATTYLSYKKFQKLGMLEMLNFDTDIGKPDPDPFYRYALLSWIHHVQKVSDFDDIMPFLQQRSLVTRIYDFLGRYVHRPPWNIAGVTALHLASYVGMIEIVKVVYKDYDLNDPGDGYTPLALAVCGKHEAVARFLLEKGANVDAKSSHTLNKTPLYYAAEAGFAAIVKLLLEYGAAVNAVEERFSRTPLYAAAAFGGEEVVKILLAHGADVNRQDGSGDTPLSQRHDVEEGVIRLLIAHGADVNLGAPLVLAARFGREALVKVLLEMKTTNVNIADKYGKTPLISAIEIPQESVTKLLLAHKDIDVNLADGQGRTPLFWACSLWRSDAIAQMLLERKDVKIELGAQRGITPTAAAAWEGRTSKLKLLVDKGADLEVADVRGVTPLLCAATKFQQETVEYLLNAGANAEARDKSGRTCLFYAVRANRWYYPRDKTDDLDPVYKFLFEFMSARGTLDINYRDRYGATLLAVAVRSNRRNIVKHLLTVEGIDLNIADTCGRTPLWWASTHDDLTQLLLETAEKKGVKLLEVHPTVQMLLEEI